MEHTSSPSAPKRTRRSDAQWRAILTEHLASNETPQQLADRLGCKLSTVEWHMRGAAAPPSPQRNVGFVEVQPSTSTRTVVLRLQTAAGVTVTFDVLPPPEYLAAALGLVP